MRKRFTYGRVHAFHSEKGGQVGCVGADHNQSKEPPQASYHTGGESTKQRQKISGI